MLNWLRQNIFSGHRIIFSTIALSVKFSDKNVGKIYEKKEISCLID